MRRQDAAWAAAVSASRAARAAVAAASGAEPPLPGPEGAEHVDARSHGAVLDGTTDDTSAVESAIDEAVSSGVGKVWLAGVALTRGISIPKGRITIEGPQSGGFSESEADRCGGLKLADNANAPLVTIPRTVRNVTLRNLRLDGNRARQQAPLDIIHMEEAERGQDAVVNVQDCLILGASGWGINVGTYRRGLYVRGGVVFGCTLGGILIGSSDNHLSTVGIGINDGPGIEVRNVLLHVDSCDIWGNFIGILARTGARWISITNTGIDRNKREAIYLQGAQASAVGCAFHSNSQSGDGKYATIRLQTVQGGSRLALSGCMFGHDATESCRPSYDVEMDATDMCAYAANLRDDGATALGVSNHPEAFTA